MLIKEGSELGMHTKIYNKAGKQIRYVKSFDTETKEAVMYVVKGTTGILKRDGWDNPIMETKILSNCIAIDSRTGKMIQDKT